MTTLCKTWFYPEEEHRPLCQEEYRPLDGAECPVCVTPFIQKPNCYNIPLGSSAPNRAHCDFVPQGNQPLQYVRNFPKWLKVVITPGALDNDPNQWPCWGSHYRGTFLCYNDSVCNDTWKSLGKGVVCSQLANGQTICVDSGPSSGLQHRVHVILNYDTSSSPQRQSFWVKLHRYQFACGTTQVTESVYKTDDVFSNNGWRFNCKDTHKVKWFRTTNQFGQVIWSPLDGPNVLPNQGFSITISPV
jgi:hypothetical protein